VERNVKCAVTNVLDIHLPPQSQQAGAATDCTVRSCSWKLHAVNIKPLLLTTDTVN